jgi:diguanylate cyclase (GGDEF)-like protein/PAS domain S-box-containing protein
VSDREALFEAALDCRADGIALFDMEGAALFWNSAAETMTGFSRTEMMSGPIPDALEPLLPEVDREINTPHGARGPRILVTAKSKLGKELKTITERKVLCDASGEPIGAAVFFHLAQTPGALPHGDSSENETGELETSQRDLEERLELELDDFARGGPPFGVLWIDVDQARELRKTHGVNACHAMLEKIRRALAQGLYPAEIIGRWGDDEFLVIAHERTAEVLAAHAHTLVGLARTADFRWWGDRVSLTVSIGVAQAASDRGETLAQLLARARQAMALSSEAGGNRVNSAAPIHVADAEEKN